MGTGRPLFLQLFRKVGIFIKRANGNPGRALPSQARGRNLKHRRGTGVRHREPLVTFLTMTKNYICWLNAKNAVELYFDDKQAFDKAMHLLLDLFRNHKDYKSMCRATLLPKYEVLKPLIGVFNEGELFIYPEVVGKTEADIKEPEEEKRGVYKLRTGTC